MNATVIEQHSPIVSSAMLDDLRVNPSLRSVAIIGGASENNPLRASALYNRHLNSEERLAHGIRDFEDYILDKREQLAALPDDTIKFRAIKELTEIVQCYQRLKTDGLREIDIIDAVAGLREGWWVPERRREAYETLRPPSTVEAIKTFCEVGLIDPDHDTKWSVIKTLQQTSDEHALNWLREVGLKNSDQAIRWASANALRRHTEVATIYALRSIGLKDVDKDVRICAANSLEGVNDPDVTHALCDVGRKDPNDMARSVVARILGGITSQQAIETLCFMAENDVDSSVCSLAAGFLERRLEVVSDPILRKQIEIVLENRKKREPWRT